MVFVIEFIVVVLIMVFSGYGGYIFANKKQSKLSALILASVGVVLINVKNIALWIPIYWYLPRIFGLYMDILQAFGALLIGVAYPLMKNKPRQRVLFAVFTIVFVFYMSFDKIYLIANSAEFSKLHSKKKDGVILQSSEYSCFPASVATILKHKGIEVTEQQVAYVARTTSRGTDPYRIIYAIESFGEKLNLSAYMKRVSIEDLDKISRPCILTVYISNHIRNIPHAIVFFGKEGDTYILGDPLYGKCKVDKKVLLDSYLWQGETLQIEEIAE